MSQFFSLLIGAALVNNLLLSLPLAADAVRSARLQALGPASALLIAMAAPLAWLLQPLNLQALQLLIFLPLLVALAWLSLQLLARPRPALAQPGLWPLLLGNGGALGVMLLSQPLNGFAQALALGVGGGLGFWLALQLFADLLDRVEQCDVPTPFRGVPIMLVSAGLMGLALLGFNGLGAA